MLRIRRWGVDEVDAQAMGEAGALAVGRPGDELAVAGEVRGESAVGRRRQAVPLFGPAGVNRAGVSGVLIM